MEIFGWSLIAVLIVRIVTPWNEVAGGVPFQQDPTHPDKSSDKHEQPLYVDTDDYPTGGVSPVRKRQPLRVVKSQKVAANTFNSPIIPWEIRSISPKSNRTRKNSTNSQTEASASSASAAVVLNGGLTNHSSPSLTPSNTESSDYDLLGGLMAEAVNEEDDAYKSRLRRMYPVFTQHGFMFTEDWFFHTTVMPPKSSYGPCVTGLGFEDNKYCAPGEVCADKTTMQEAVCPGKVCPACGAGPKPPKPSAPCPPGCKPGANCPDPSPDGVCIDSTFGTDQYDDVSTSEKDPSPMVYFGGQLKQNDSCVAYGDAIDMFNRGHEEFNDKMRKLRLTPESSGTFGSGICNWAVSRLQCIANEPRIPPTPAPPPPAAGPSPSDDDENLDRPKGSCKCMLALGERAVAVKNVNGTAICYIPANRGYHSKCSHGIYLPYGGIDGVRKDGKPYVKLQMEPASKFCVPNGECKPGYKYTGLRCMCKKNYVWEPHTSTCSKAWRLKPQSRSGNIIIFYALLCFFNIG